MVCKKSAGWWFGFTCVAGFAAHSPASFAGKESSGGGNVVACFDDARVVTEIVDRYDGAIQTTPHLAHLRSVEAFDLYYARRPNGALKWPQDKKFIPIATGADLVDHYRERFPALAETLRRGYGHFDAFKNERSVWEPLVDHTVETMDAVARRKKLILPAEGGKCMVATAMVQEMVGEGETAYFYLTIDQRLMAGNVHPAYSREVLRAHEAVYSVARQLGAVDSRGTTLLLARAITDGDGVTANELKREYRALGFRPVGFGGDFPVFTALDALGAELAHEYARIADDVDYAPTADSVTREKSARFLEALAGIRPIEGIGRRERAVAETAIRETGNVLAGAGCWQNRFERCRSALRNRQNRNEPIDLKPASALIDEVIAARNEAFRRRVRSAWEAHQPAIANLSFLDGTGRDRMAAIFESMAVEAYGAVTMRGPGAYGAKSFFDRWEEAIGAEPIIDYWMKPEDEARSLTRARP